MDEFDEHISMTSRDIFSGVDNIVLDPAGVANPYSLSSEPPPSHVFRQTQHLRYFLRGRLSSPFLHLSHNISGNHKICRSPTRWHGCVIHPNQPSHSRSLSPGAFGLVWYVDSSSTPPSHHTCPLQFRKGPAHRRIRGNQEDYEALQHTCPLQTHVSRAQTSQAHPTRKRLSPLPSFLSLPILSLLQIISLSDVFISPLEDMCVSRALHLPPCPRPRPHRLFCQLFCD
jgi:hypothetical protein